MTVFPRASKKQFGYSITEVDRLIARARDQYTNASAQVFNWRELTSTEFSLEKGGYRVDAVDSALGKLQDTFAERELAGSTSMFFSPNSAGSKQSELEKTLVGRTIRPRGKRFTRSSVLALGYSRKQVDTLLNLIEQVIQGKAQLELSEVRALRFTLKRGGYIESQVDGFVDRLVEYLQAKRIGVGVANASHHAEQPSVGQYRESGSSDQGN